MQLPASFIRKKLSIFGQIKTDNNKVVPIFSRSLLARFLYVCIVCCGYPWLHLNVKGAPDPEVYRGLLCLRKILQKPNDSVPQQDCEYLKLKSGCEN